MNLRYLTLIQKCVSKNNLFLAISITTSILMFQIFTGILLLKAKNSEHVYSYKKKQAGLTLSNDKIYLFYNAL
jgi:hypothetical protein